MTALLTAAVAATLADATTFLLLIVHGPVPESNPVVRSLSVAAALWARAAVVVLLVALTVLAAQRPTRRLRLTVGAALLVAIGVGMVGAASTLAAAG